MRSTAATRDRGAINSQDTCLKKWSFSEKRSFLRASPLGEGLARRASQSLFILFTAVCKAVKIIPLWRVSDKAFHN